MLLSTLQTPSPVAVASIMYVGREVAHGDSALSSRPCGCVSNSRAASGPPPTTRCGQQNRKDQSTEHNPNRLREGGYDWEMPNPAPNSLVGHTIQPHSVTRTINRVGWGDTGESEYCQRYQWTVPSAKKKSHLKQKRYVAASLALSGKGLCWWGSGQKEYIGRKWLLEETEFKDRLGKIRLRKKRGKTNTSVVADTTIAFIWSC